MFVCLQATKLTYNVEFQKLGRKQCVVTNIDRNFGFFVVLFLLMFV